MAEMPGHEFISINEDWSGSSVNQIMKGRLNGINGNQPFKSLLTYLFEFIICHILHCIFWKKWFFTKIKRKIFFFISFNFSKNNFFYLFFIEFWWKNIILAKCQGGGDTSDPRACHMIYILHNLYQKHKN